MFCLENLLSEDVLRELSSVRRCCGIEKDDLAVVLFGLFLHVVVDAVILLLNS